MRKYFSALLLAAFVATAGSVASAQQFTTDALSGGLSSTSGWERVMAMPSGSNLYVRGTTKSTHCKLKSADADSLTCVSGAKTEVYQKAEIASVRIPHRGRSAAIGAAAGGAGGGIAGAAVGQNGQIIGRGGLAAIFAVPLAVIGALIGLATDFAGSTIYRG
jgi:hypothetical protein